MFFFILKRSKPKFDQNDRQELVEMIRNELEFSLKWNKGIYQDFFFQNKIQFQTILLVSIVFKLFRKLKSQLF